MIPNDRKQARTHARDLSDFLNSAEQTAMPLYLRAASEDARTALEWLINALNRAERGEGYDSDGSVRVGINSVYGKLARVTHCETRPEEPDDAA